MARDALRRKPRIRPIKLEPRVRARSIVPRSCPRCGALLVRVHRKPWEKLTGPMMRTVRHRCSSQACGWEGSHFGRINRKVTLGLFWLFMVGLAILVATVGGPTVDRLVKPPRGQVAPQTEDEYPELVR